MAWHPAELTGRDTERRVLDRLVRLSAPVRARRRCGQLSRALVASLAREHGYSPSPLLQGRGGYRSPEEARAAARILLPDILRYDRSQPAHYPNGLLDDFPYLGPPNA